MSAQSIESIIKTGIGRRKSAEAAAKKSARRQNPNTKKRRTSAKSTARKAAGQKALKRAGTGCIVKSMKNRAGAKETLAYASENDKNELIFSNCGSDSAAQESTMNAVANLRKDCVKNTGHISISLAKNNASFTPEKWRELVEFALDELEIDRDNFASVAYLHKDTKNPHIHICFSRIGYDSKIHESHNIGDLGIATAQKIEVKFGLILTPKNDNNRGKKPPSQGMLERYRRTGEPPKLILLQASIDAAMEGAKTMDEFQNRLELLGVNAQFNVQEKDGKLNHVSGLTYAFIDGSFKASASALGDRYGLYSLKKKGLVYEPATTAINIGNAPIGEPADNKPVSQEDTRANNNDNGRADFAQPIVIQSGSGAGEAEPASQSLNSTERRKLRRAAAQTPDNSSLNNISDVSNGAGSDVMEVKLTRKQRREAEHQAKMQLQAKQYFAEEAILKEINAAKTEAKEEALLQAGAEPVNRQKRVEAIKPFKDISFKNSNLPDNRYKHEMAIKLDGIKTPTIPEIEEAENEAIKVLLNHGKNAIEGDFSPPKIQQMLNKNSLLHKQIPNEIALPENADANLIKYVERIEKQRVDIILQSKLAVEKAAKQLEALRKLEKPTPKTASEWTPPQPK